MGNTGDKYTSYYDLDCNDTVEHIHSMHVNVGSKKVSLI